MLRAFRDKLFSLSSSELNRKIFSHSFWILLGNTVSKFALLGATMLMTNYLTKDEYGQFGIIKSTILTFAAFAGLELGLTATKYISQYHNKDRSKVEGIVGISNFVAIFISLVISAVIYTFSAEIAVQINAPALSKEIKLSSFIVFFSSLNGIQNGILAGLERFKEMSVNNLIAGLLSAVLLVLASKYYGLYAVVVAFGSNFLLLFLLNLVSLKKNFYSDYSINIFSKKNFEQADVLWKFSLPAILAGLMVAPVTWYCNYLLVNSPEGFSEMANFDLASQWRNTILFIPSALSQIALPMLSSSVEDKESYRTIFFKNLKLNGIVGFIAVIIFVVLSPVILMFYKEDYNNALWPLIIMFVTTGFIAVNNVIGQAIASQGKMWLGFYVNLLWAIVLISSSLLFINYFKLGAVGISLAYLVSYLFHTFVQYLLIKKGLNIK